MKKLFFDIETIPADDTMRDAFLAYKLKSGDGEPTAEVIDETYARSSFDGGFGRICCIGYIKETGSGIERGVLKGDEKKMLQDFWRLAADVNLFIGHNVFGFDFPFIYQRSIVHRVKPRFDLSFARYRKNPVFDTMCEWTLWAYDSGTKRSLDALSKVLGLPTSKDQMDGSQVWPYYQAGRIDDICTYCMKDVELTRQVYYRMIVEDPPVYEKAVQDDIPF